MSGHSKWATTKRHKEAVDSKRGKLFSLIGKELTIAARLGGGDPDFNARLRNLIQKAKAANMPAENIKKAIQKGTGEVPGFTIEELLYEAYIAGGVGLVIEVTTDNKNRAASEVRSTLTKCGGNLATPGALMFNFQRVGQIFIPKSAIGEDKLMDMVLSAGANDLKTDDEECYEVLCPISEFYNLENVLSEAKVAVQSSELAYIPNTVVEITDQDVADKLMRIMEKLDDLDDVKNVFANFELGDNIVVE
ncbi:MAG: YebC/PmpR family DNA-binding transcriptional regulator [Puniceicoccales bacterium]|jgi:YebC/PmpR family DNA-binding regulatory protein|nr:YebC/PmpR family DNA-binding transcriptional regulator [Puniceicoccales bacterium]